MNHDPARHVRDLIERIAARAPLPDPPRSLDRTLSHQSLRPAGIGLLMAGLLGAAVILAIWSGSGERLVQPAVERTIVVERLRLNGTAARFHLAEPPGVEALLVIGERPDRRDRGSMP